MKKLFRIFTAIALLLCMAPNLFAADIIIKGVKIKKKHPRSTIDTNGNPKDNIFVANEMTITTTTEKGSKVAGYTEFAFEFTVEAKKDAEVSDVTMDITVTDCNLKSVTTTISAKPIKTGPGTHTCNCKISMPSSGDCPLVLTSADINVINPAGEVADFEAKLNKKDKTKGDCNASYKLKEITFLTDNISGFYIMNFSFSFDKKDFPDEVTMLVQVTDCKGNKATVPVKLSYDPNTGMAIGSAGILQNKECQWNLTYGEVYGTNPCGDETTWTSDFGQVKTSGAGTRTTASTTQSGRPELK